MFDLPNPPSSEMHYLYDKTQELVISYNDLRVTWWNRSNALDRTEDEMLLLSTSLFNFLTINNADLAEIAKKCPNADLLRVSFDNSVSAALNSLSNFIADTQIGPVPASEFLYDVFLWIAYVILPPDAP